MSSSSLIPAAYYLLSNSITGPNLTLSLGVQTTIPPPPVTLGQLGAYSSENWELFLDDEVYFIRNHDYGAPYQLGMTKDQPQVPQLLNATTEPGQQWKLNLQADGTYLLLNGLSGSLLSIGPDANNNAIAVMSQNDEADSFWSTSINLSAGNIDESALKPYPSIESGANFGKASVSASASTSASASKSTSSLTSKSTSSLTSTSISSSTSTSTSSSTSTTESSETTTSIATSTVQSSTSSTSTSTSSGTSTPTQVTNKNNANSLSKGSMVGVVFGGISWLFALTVV